MPITLKPNQAKYKTSEGYQTLNVLADETTQQKIEKINQVADEKIDAIEQLTNDLITDVKVDGTSVVTNHVANINGMAKSSDITEINGKVNAVETQLSQVRSDISDQGEQIEDHENRIKELEDAPAPVGGVSDVQVNDTSIVNDRVAKIPNASTSSYGLTKFNNTYGITHVSNGVGGIYRARDEEIDSRNNNYRPIVPSNLDYAVKQAMCDGKGAEWTDAEKASARERIGAERKVGDWELLNSITLTEDTIYIDINNADDGTPYDLIGLKCRIQTPAGNKSGVMDFKCKVNGGSYGNINLSALYTLPANNYTPPSTYVSTGLQAFVPVGGQYFSYGGGCGQGGTITVYLPSNGSGYAFDVFKNHITGIYAFLYSNPQVPFLAGTKIEVYGIKYTN